MVLDVLRRRAHLGGEGVAQRRPPCIVCKRVCASDRTVLRFSQGRVEYTSEGCQFHRELWPSGWDFLWAHVGCAFDLVYMNKVSWCDICRRQFAQDVPGTAMLVERGEINTVPNVSGVFFKFIQGGTVHWSCAADHWDADLFNCLWEVKQGGARKDGPGRLRALPKCLSR